ncbi:hypothetical protein K1719_032596 [Acacia pycnantha]|nr:hypothetical protein K1719_032596 [Acacia pycnantha]
MVTKLEEEMGREKQTMVVVKEEERRRSQRFPEQTLNGARSLFLPFVARFVPLSLPLWQVGNYSQFIVSSSFLFFFFLFLLCGEKGNIDCGGRIEES